MHFILSAFLLLIISSSAFGSTLFHSYITDLSPPYFCKLKLKKAEGVSLSPVHRYEFSGICSIKLPVGNTWIYQNVWVETAAVWNAQTNDALETTTLANNMGTVTVQMKCDDDPWLTKGQCALLGYQNNSQYSNLGGVYNPRTGQYPTFEIITGQYPPLARNQAIMQEAIALSILTARQQAGAAQTAFNQTFGGTTTTTVATRPPAPAVTIVKKKIAPKCITRVFYKPKMNNMRLDICLSLNHDCGKPAADRFCRSMGYREARNCKLDTVNCKPTFLIGTKSVCNHSFCKGFDMIECIKCP